jgi:hypothetical protein
MTEVSRYVAIVTERDGDKSTFVFDGAMSLHDVFAKINANTGWKTITSASIHRDESLEPTFVERAFGERCGAVNGRMADESQATHPPG